MPRRAQVRRIERGDRDARWGVSIPVGGGRVRRRWFVSRAERDREFARLVAIDREEGRRALAVSSGDADLLADLRRILPEGCDPRVAARYYVEHAAARASMPLGEAIRAFLRRQQARGVSPEYMQHLGLAMDRLRGALGDVDVAAVSSGQMLGLLSGLPFAPVTVAGHFRMFQAFFRWCEESRIVAESPMRPLRPPRQPEREPEFMRADDVARLFSAAERVAPQFCWVLALSFFAGLRSSSIFRLEVGDLDFAQRGIRLRGDRHKTGRRFFVQGFEPNLWAWLDPLRGAGELQRWPSSTAIKLRASCVAAAGVRYPHNGGRHSFATYHVALHGSADRTATLLTHMGSVAMLYSHYRGNAATEEARRYFSVAPGGSSPSRSRM